MRSYLELIKFAHTVFALPFALVGFFIGVHSAHGEFDTTTLIYVLLCMVFARSAAMAFNRYADRKYDALNERTSNREIPSGQISARNALIFTITSSVLFIVTTWFINRLVFFLSPVALFITLGYSYTKRFTSLSHFVLGLGLALAPVGAYLAVTARFDPVAILMGLIVLLWVGGFDIIYALQDTSFDKGHSLYSIPSWLGPEKGLAISSGAHIICSVVCIATAIEITREYTGMNWLLWIGTAVFILSLWYQHSIVKADDLSRVDRAFFTTNGIASIAYSVLLISDFYI